MDVKLRQLNDAVPVDPESLLSSTLPSATISPDDRLEQALAELREAAAGELLENLIQVSPGRFEVIVLDVLHRLGYGASHHDLLRVDGTGDGGKAGVIRSEEHTSELQP